MLKFEIPEGFTKHNGESCPLPIEEQHNTMVEVYFADASGVEDVVGSMTADFWKGGVDDWWDWSKTIDEDDRIVAWKVTGVVEPIDKSTLN